MRRLLFVAALPVVLAMPAALSARPNPVGDGSLSIKNGRGEFIVQVKGALVGRMAFGKLTVTDSAPYDEQVPDVRGRIRTKPKLLNDATTVYQGQQIRFRVMEGAYKLKIVGVGVNLSAVGRGWVVLDGDDRFNSAGVYSLNGDPYEPVPFERTQRLKLAIPATPPGPRSSGRVTVAP
jgi:hypothetical protein